MKKLFKKSLAVIMVVVMTFTAAPLDGLDSIFAPEAQAKVISDYAVGDIIEFGLYPQSEVTDSALLSSLNSLPLSWVSYGYYSGTGNTADGQMKPGDFMKYADIEYMGKKYRAVTFFSYRPNYTGDTCSASDSYQDDNGYTTGNIYWFEYEPLEWRVLDPEEGFVLCESVIDSQPYNNIVYYKYSTSLGSRYSYYNSTSCLEYANDYESSSIRLWLNNDFYNLAFDDNEKGSIGYTTFDNNCYYTDYTEFNGKELNDKIFLLSYTEAQNFSYGFSTQTGADTARTARVTPYATIQGAFNHSGYTNWRLRTPGEQSYLACYVYDNGLVDGYYISYGVNTALGIRPAFKFNPGSEIFESLYEISNREFENNLDYYAENTDSSDYEPVLANMMAALSKAVYSERDIKRACKSLGFETYGVYDYTGAFNPHTCGYSFALKKSDYSDDIICLVSIRGSNNISDWIGNLELATFENEKHIGFAYPANRIYETIQNVVGNKGLNVKYFITGHSRGAAVANLLSVKLMENGVSSSDIYNYNFACPDVACKYSFSYYSNIFNLCNREDAVPFIPGNFASALTSPGTSWGKFGKTYWFTKDAPDTINPFADHDMGLYLEFFDQQLAPSDWGKSLEDKWDDAVHTLYGWITKIKCPVDVIITDENGNNIASVIGGEVNYYNSQVGDVLIFTDGDKKVIYINGDNDFNVNLVGTDNGEMTYSVEKYNVQSEEVLESKTFTNVKLEEGKAMFSPVSNADNADDVELFVTETQNGQQVVTHTVNTNGTETAVENETPDEPSDPSINWEEITPEINKPSKTTINYGDTLVLTLGEIEIPEGYAIAWFVEGAGVSTWVSENGLECRVTSIANGNPTIYAKLVDEEENVVTNADGEEIFDEITLTSKAGFWQRFISFFKNLFRINRVIY